MTKDFELKIWGARGSLPAPAANNQIYGSDTCCVEMRCGERRLVFDAGTGIFPCGQALRADGVKTLDVFFSHCHLDHIIGLPFAIPLYKDHVAVRLYAGHFTNGTTCQQMVEDFMCPPYFPVTPKQFAADISYRDFRPSDVIDLGEGIRVGTQRLVHPNGAVGYRVDYDGRSACYITDTEHEPGRMNAEIRDFVAGSDVMIYDCCYTDEEFDHYKGYGHSTWQEGVRIAEAAGVERLVIFHHNVGRDDAWLSALETRAKDAFPGAIVARTGLTIGVRKRTSPLLGEMSHEPCP